jgi:hypothetical protein
MDQMASVIINLLVLLGAMFHGHKLSPNSEGRIADYGGQEAFTWCTGLGIRPNSLHSSERTSLGRGSDGDGKEP